ncbi:hypothetical protein [Opitutus terrae]|uniref:hypothetical protein n=1 Tax=Opitutus terrae TaxID=107709 RepID=UPI0011D0B00C|nr:hypothetical protein [Opitutus terrae]
MLVDVGAAGGVNRIWHQIARYATGVGFEPDARDSAVLQRAQLAYKRWILCPELVVPESLPDGKAVLHLTRSPHCSSTLRPDQTALREWGFAQFFEVHETRRLPATTLGAALAARGLDRVDWLKCDTQGLDLKLYHSLPISWREQILAVEFEPGVIDAYQGEDKLAAVLTAMAGEPFWLAELQIGRTVRLRLDLAARWFGASWADWVRRLAAGAPTWANVRFLRDPAMRPDTLDRRALLLGWVFATLAQQHGAALLNATVGGERYGKPLFEELARSSVRRLRLQMLRGLPAALWRRLCR